MTVYAKSESASIFWPEKIERVYQSLPSGPATRLAPKLPHLSDWEALFVGTLPADTERESSPRADYYVGGGGVREVSSTSVYALGQRIQERIVSLAAPAPPLASWSPRAWGPKTMG